MTSVFNPKNCTIPDVPPIEDMPVLVDCDIPFAPDPITDCPDIDLPIPAILGWMGFECVGGPFGPPGPGGAPGPPGPPGPPGSGVCIRVHTKTKCVKKKKKVRVEVITRVKNRCVHIHFFFYVLCPKRDKEVCCWWKYCPDYAPPGDPADALFECKHGVDGYTSPYVGNGGDSGDDCPWVLMTRSANDCEDCDKGPCSVELIGAYEGQVEIWCDCNDVAFLDCHKCGACHLPDEIEATIDMYYEYRAEYLDEDGDKQYCWIPIGVGGGVCDTFTLVREHQDEENSYGCWAVEVPIDKFKEDFTDEPDATTTGMEATAEYGGELCDFSSTVPDGKLCPIIKWCCDATDENQQTPKMQIQIGEGGDILELTGLANQNLCTEAGAACALAPVADNGWIRKCLIDCDGDEIPVDNNDACVEWCHGYDVDEAGTNPPVFEVPICGSEETRLIRIHQFAMSISCQCCDSDSEVIA